jgi:tocopherol O-methyltransferase
MTASSAPIVSVTAAAVARHYDELDPFYRELWGEHVHHGLWRTGDETPEEAVECLIDHVADAVALRPGEQVIDVGAGYGGTGRRLAARFGARVTGLTLSAAQHAYAEGVSADTGEAHVLLGDWLANDMPSHSADVVIAIESTEHMADLPRALAEMRRVLRPGGRVAVCAWLTGEAPAPWQRRWLLEPLMRDGHLVTLNSATAFAGLLEDGGFDEISVEDLSAAVARTWTVSLQRVLARLLSDARYVRYLTRRESTEKRFLTAMFRIAAAYATGTMRYGLFVGRRPA